jgi:hypothetical protein
MLTHARRLFSGALRACVLPGLLSLMTLAACQPEIPTMTPEETRTLDALTARMTPRCVGRYLIDLPADFVINPIRTAKLEGVDIDIEPMKRYQFDEVLRKRHDELRKERIMGEDTPSLTAAMPLSDNSGYVFNRSENQTDAVSRTLEVLAFRNGFKIVIQINAVDLALDKYPANYQSLKTNVQEKLAHLLSLYSRVRGRADDEVPAEPGVCFANGFLQGAPTDAEQVDLYYHLSTAEDVYFAFHSLSDLVQDNELLDRGRAIEAMLKESSGHTVRKGRVNGSIPSAQEWLMTKKSSESGLMYQHFTLEANAKTGSAQTPVLVLDMNAGIRHPGPALTLEQVAVQKPLSKTTFSEAQSVALWNKTALTLRPRPAAGPASPVKPVTVKPSGTASVSSAQPFESGASTAGLGASVASPLAAVSRTLPNLKLPTGALCPRTGTWVCDAAHGGERRSFVKGETFQGVRLAAAPSLWQKLKGEAASEVVGTTWTLVEIPEDGEA